MYDHKAKEFSRHDISSVLEVLPEEVAEEVWERLNEKKLKIKGIDTPPKEKKPRSRWNIADDSENLDLFLENRELSSLINKTSQKGLLTQREEIEYSIIRLKAEREGDKEKELEAKHELAGRNSRLVLSVAKKHVGRGVPLSDLFQEGYIGLLRGVEKFDWKRGFKLSTYITWWISQGVKRVISNENIHPAHFMDKIRKLNNATSFLVQKLGIENPSSEDIAEFMEITPQQVEDIWKNWKEIESLEDPISGEGDDVLGETIADPHPGPQELLDEKGELEMVTARAEEFLSKLTPRKRKILKARYMDKEKDETISLSKVGQKFGVTRERIRQIEAEAKGNMLKYLHKHKNIDPEDFQGILDYVYGERDK